MPRVEIVEESSLPPERVLAAAHDFSERRSKIFSAVQPKYFEVHSTGENSADVTEGTKAGPVLNWERCDYDWSKPDSVLANVTDSNIYNPDGSWWELKATPAGSGSRVEMTWVRSFKRTAKGRFFNFVFKHAGNRLFGRYAREIIENLEKLEASS
jgi:polyketide cyclase/dehydrase/lipid transport protein